MKSKFIRLCAGLWLAGGWAAWAVQFIPMSIEEMAQKSSLVVQGVVRSAHSEQDQDGRIFTRVELQVSDTWKGRAAANPLVIVHGGGQLGSRRARGSGQVDYQPGEEVVAFLVINPRGEAVTLGMAQGQFHIGKDAITGEKLARNIFHGAGQSPGSAIERLGAPIQRRLTLGSLKQQVQGASR